MVDKEINQEKTNEQPNTKEGRTSRPTNQPTSKLTDKQTRGLKSDKQDGCMQTTREQDNGEKEKERFKKKNDGANKDKHSSMKQINISKKKRSKQTNKPPTNLKNKMNIKKVARQTKTSKENAKWIKKRESNKDEEITNP